ncbi:MAG TPA: ABC transporter permease [bacterium]|nr:ABC transporter permease [bacterium]
MGVYLLRRLVALIPLVFGITAITFAILVLAPGDPVLFLIPPEQRGTADIAQFRHELGMDRPVPVQYVSMMSDLFTGRLRSFGDRRPTTRQVADALPTTLILTATSLALTGALALPIALVSALRPYSVVDHAATLFSLLGISLPTFWFGLVLIFIFTERLGLLPASGIRPTGVSGYSPFVIWRFLIMPTVVQALGILPVLVRYARSSLLDSLSQDYVQVARSKGLAERTVVLKHVARNSLLPVLTIMALLLPFLLSGSVVVESIFALPGVGRLAVSAALSRDYPTVLTTTVIAGMLVVVSNLLADLGYFYLDPRIRHG